jgi:hypothetical protein
MAEDGFVTSRGGSPQPREGAPRNQIFLEMLAVLLGAFVGWLYALGMTWTASVLILLAIPCCSAVSGGLTPKFACCLAPSSS